MAAILRAADVPLVYFRDGVEITEHAIRGDLGTIAVGAPIELQHGGPVVGHVSAVRSDPDALIVEFEITDPATKARVEAGEFPHVSADYSVDHLDSTNGQKGVVIRAAALVPKGRCGDACGVRLDAAPGVFSERGTMILVTTVKIAGKDYAAGSPEAAKAIELEAKRLDGVSKRLDAEASAALRARVESALGVTIRKDAPDQEILIETVKKIAPGVDLSSASPDYIAGAFAVAIAMALDLQGAESEPGPDDGAEPAADAAPARPPAAGASAIRADVFQARTAPPAKSAAKSTERALSPSEKARKDMIARGRGQTFAPAKR